MGRSAGQTPFLIRDSENIDSEIKRYTEIKQVNGPWVNHRVVHHYVAHRNVARHNVAHQKQKS